MKVKKKAKILENLQDISENANITIQTIENANAFATLSNGNKIGFTKLNLHDLVITSIDEHSLPAQRKNIKLSLNSSGKLVVVANHLIRNVFTNIINNAIKYGNKNSEVLIDLTRIGSKWRFSVTSKGKIIPDKEKTEIFERFKRLAKEGSGSGHGLGLAIVKGIMDKHKGKVWIEDYKKEGSKFIVEAPIKP